MRNTQCSRKNQQRQHPELPCCSPSPFLNAFLGCHLGVPIACELAFPVLQTKAMTTQRRERRRRKKRRDTVPRALSRHNQGTATGFLAVGFDLSALILTAKRLGVTMHSPLCQEANEQRGDWPAVGEQSTWPNLAST
jgi:hypothetical protein